MRPISDSIARIRRNRSSAAFPAHDSGRLIDLDGFGSNPGALDAKIYVPAGLARDAPLVVVLHGCTQAAAGFDHGSGWSQLADQAGFAVLFPEQRRANNANLCFNWFEPDDFARLGGEAESIAQMVETLIASRGLDRSRIFVTGLSAGGAMAAVMLATYPDVFAGGAIIGGLPYGCATSVPQAFERMRGHGHSDDRSAAAIVRRAATGVDDRLPVVSIWHGSTDGTVVPANMERLTSQWRRVRNLVAVPSEVQRGPNWERRIWRDADGRSAVEQWSVVGMGHGVPIDPSGTAALGRAGPFMLDVGLSSTLAIAACWGIAAGEAASASSVQAPAEPPADPWRYPGNSMVQDIIENALRSAGMMR